MAIFPIIILIIAVVGWLAYQHHQRTVATWRRVAARLGLQIAVGSTFSRPTISGNLNGLPVRIDTFVRRHGKNSISVS